MSNFYALIKRELVNYFVTPLAYVFIVIFIILNFILTFYIGNFYEANQASLQAFFGFHPWLYLLFIPALSMRLWSEERKIGTIELLLTLPVKLFTVVLAKFVATWLICALSLLLTVSMWLTTSYLGDPEHGVIILSYFASWLISGCFLAIGCCLSALTSNQVVAFILTVLVCFFFVVTGTSIVVDFLQLSFIPTVLVDMISNLSVLTHFMQIAKGVILLSDIVYFFVIMGAWLIATAVLIDIKKAN